MNKFKYQLGEGVALRASEEMGDVIARSEFQYCENQYLVRYRAGDGRMVEVWWAESALGTP